MPRELENLEITATKPGEDAPFATIETGDIASITIEERAQDATSTGSIVVDNEDGPHTGSQRITSGDKLVIKTQLASEASLTRRWTAVARSISDENWVPSKRTFKELSIDASDYVFTTLGWRTVEASFEDEDAGNIVDSLVEEEAPEIGRDQIETVGQATDAFYSGRFLKDVVCEDQAAIGDALVRQDGTDLVFKPLKNVSVKHALTPADFQADVSVESNDARIANHIRVDGGEDHAIDDEQTTQSDTTTVTDSNRITHQLQVRKSEVARLQLYTQTTGSGDSVTVRLQADRGGSPVDVSDQQSDIARRELDSQFLANDGFTTFLLPAHTLAPGEGPWLIIESGDSGGQNIGTDGSGTPTYRAEYPYPLISRAVNSSSQDEYRRRDKAETDEQLDSFDAVRNRALSVANHRGSPETLVEASAASDRAHNLHPGEAVQLPGSEWPGDLSGVFLVLERTTEYANRLLRTELALQDIDSI